MSQSGTGGPVGAILALPAETTGALGNVANIVARIPGQVFGAATQPFMHNAFTANNPVTGAGGSTPLTPTAPQPGAAPGSVSGHDPKTPDVLSVLGGASAGAGARSAAEAMQAAQRGAPTVAYGQEQDTGQQVAQLLWLIDKIRGEASR